MPRLRAWLIGLGGSRVLTNVSWLYLDQVLRAVLVLAAFGAVARHLGPADFGVLSYAVAFAGLFVPLAVMGLDYVVVMELVRMPGRERAVLSTAMLIKCLGLILALLVAGGGWLLTSADNAARPLLGVTVLSLVVQPLLVCDAWFQSKVASRQAVLARLASSVIGNGTRLIFVAKGAPLGWFAWVFAAEAMMYGLILLFLFRRTSGITAWSLLGGFDAGLARLLMRRAWPLFLADLAIMGYLKVDQLLLGKLGGSEELGRYASAFRLADAAEYFLLALINSHFPLLVATHARNADEFLGALAGFLRRMTGLAVLVAAGLSVASVWVILLVLGPDYAGTSVVLVLLAWANVFVTIVAVRGKWFLLEGLQRWSLVMFVAGAMLHLGGVWFAVPRWGAVGAASSFLVAQVGMALFVPLLFRSTRPAAVLALRSLFPLRG